MSSLAQLRSEHAELVKIVKELKALIEGDAPPPAVALFDVRRRLSSVLIAHLKAEDWVLYPPLLSSADVRVAETARHFVDEMGGLAQAFTVYVERWDALSIESDWSRYQRESHGIIEALTNRIIRENQELYPLLERIERAA
jgi:iron-sulfur cluster repair protein YtfE (RIC family)